MVTSCAAGRFLDMPGVRALKNAPTKTELMEKLAIMIKKASLQPCLSLVATDLKGPLLHTSVLQSVHTPLASLLLLVVWGTTVSDKSSNSPCMPI